MHSLAELQGSFTRAMTSGDAGALGTDPRTAHRLAIHLRHYQASLTAALREKFPACVWLVGADLVRDAALAYVRSRPPSAPCIAEYGWDFPAFLAGYDRTRAVPYLETFAALELAVAQASIEVEAPPLAWSALSRLGPERLLEAVLVLQPGLRYVHSHWRIDELMATYLHRTEQEQFVLEESSTHIEVHGARGDVRLRRLDAAAFRFRAELTNGSPVGNAAAAALDVAAAFDAGAALRELVAAGLVIAACEPATEEAT